MSIMNISIIDRAFLLCIVLALFTTCSFVSAENTAVTIISSEGAVEIFDTQTNEWVPVRAPYKITQGDKIKTSKIIS